MTRAAVAFTMACILSAMAFAGSDPVRAAQVELLHQSSNTVNQAWPGIGCWFWKEEEFKPEGYKRFIDLHRAHSNFSLLTTSIRYPVEVTDPEVHDQIKRAAEYAKANGMSMVMDLDVRLARQAFQDAYPEELQEIVCLRETPLAESGEVRVSVDAVDLSDHYTFGSAKTYCTVSSRLLRAYAYRGGPGGIAPETVEDITARCAIEQADTKGLTVTIPCDMDLAGKTACVMAAFTLFTPDVFAPHLIEFERGILQQYADVPLAGACKDEWGFPGRFKVSTDDLWYSTTMAAEYARRLPNHNLVRDLLLMSKGEQGRARERVHAINVYMEMSWMRNSEIENAFYDGIKSVFGPKAMSATHPTWYPFPGELEAYKNGLDWWACKRDLAQTDESTPYAARTALAKKWHSPLWYNMYYSQSAEAYHRELWSAVLAGGRINFHPFYPAPLDEGNAAILKGDLMRAECRVRLLNYISTAPVDCPVAVVFGHPAALNFAGDSFGKTGVEITDALWAAGYYADLIPSSDFVRGAALGGHRLEDGQTKYISYELQRYKAVVLFHPQFDKKMLAAFFGRYAKEPGRPQTALYSVGEWTVDFDGNDFDASTLLPAEMKPISAADCARNVIAGLQATGVEPQTPCTLRGGSGFPDSMLPQMHGQCQLLDGTVIVASGEKSVLGDPIQQTVSINGFDVSIDAVGLAAVRLDEYGNIEALAAGGLKRIAAPHVTIELPERIDVSLWKGDFGKWSGVVHGYDGPIPERLLHYSDNWQRVRVPTPYQP